MSAADVAAWTDPVPSLEELGAVHFVGIGGAGMSGIARILLARGVPVSGSDRRDTPTLLALRALGVPASATVLDLCCGRGRHLRELPGALGIDLDTVVAGLNAVTPAFGRAETIAVGPSELQLLLVKNPAGANEILRTLALEPGELELLGVLNDRIADGRDVGELSGATATEEEVLRLATRHTVSAAAVRAEAPIGAVA